MDVKYNQYQRVFDMFDEPWDHWPLLCTTIIQHNELHTDRVCVCIVCETNFMPANVYIGNCNEGNGRKSLAIVGGLFFSLQTVVRILWMEIIGVEEIE